MTVNHPQIDCVSVYLTHLACHTHTPKPKQQLSRSKKQALAKKRKREEKKAAAAVSGGGSGGAGGKGGGPPTKKIKPKMTYEERRAKFLRPKKSGKYDMLNFLAQLRLRALHRLISISVTFCAAGKINRPGSHKRNKVGLSLCDPCRYLLLVFSKWQPSCSLMPWTGVLFWMSFLGSYTD